MTHKTDYHEGAMFGVMAMAIGKPEWLLLLLFVEKYKKHGCVLFYWNNEHCYMKIDSFEGTSDLGLRGKEYCDGAEEAYKEVTAIPFERAIVRYEMDGNMLKDGEWIFIDEADSSLQNLRLDWKSRNELDNQHVPRLQNSIF